MMLSDMMYSVWERILYKCLDLNSFIPNLILGVVLSVLSVCFLRYHSVHEEGFIRISVFRVITFSVLFIVAVILVSPLPFGGNGDILRFLSVCVSLTVLAITSYMDRQTGFFINGYLVVGFSVNLLLCIIALCMRVVVIDKPSGIMLVCCFAVNILLGIISYSSGDCGLVFMVMFSLVLLDVQHAAFAFLLCEIFAMIHYLFRTIPLLIRALRKRGKLRFPFTQSIFVGAVVAMFLIG